MSSPLRLVADLIDVVADMVTNSPVYLHAVGWRRSMLVSGTFNADAIYAVADYVRTASEQSATSVDWKTVFEKVAGLKDVIEGVISGGFTTPVTDNIRSEALT